MSNQSAPPNPARRAALYVRTTPPYDIADADLQSLQSYAAQSGYPTVSTYRDESQGGGRADRAGLDQLRADAAQGRFDVVLVAHHTRLANTQVDAQAIIEELERYGVAVESLAGDIPLTDS